MTTTVDFLKSFGFELTKFISTKVEFLKQLPESLIHPDVSDFNLLGKSGSALGVQWSLQDDSFFYNVSLKILERQATKRSLLSALASVFDPLGHLGFALVPAKLILQTAFRIGCEWDQALPSDLQKDVRKWIKNISNLKALHVPRLMIAPNPRSLELHVFCDASSLCYAAVAYFRTVS